MFRDILLTLETVASTNFENAAAQLEERVNADEDFLETLKQIGTIPESIPHDSTEEKLFSKASDTVLARAFREIGLKATVLRERGDSGDVMAESPLHGYTLVADAKAFRMSRTAKNQKDFKVAALSGWRKDAEFAVLCSPYFQYPAKSSQIYAQAIEHNVCLLSWEHLIFLIEHGVRESVELSLSPLWGFADAHAHKVLFAERKNAFIQDFNQLVLSHLKLGKGAFDTLLRSQIAQIALRGDEEKGHWLDEMDKISRYSREKAIEELIKSKKINEKILQIDTYVRGLRI